MPKEENFLADVLLKYKSRPYALISLLQNLQDHYGFLSPKILLLVSQKLNLPPAKIYGIVTFYSQFKLKPVGKYLIRVCLGTACHVKRSNELLDYLQNKYGLKPGETTQNQLITLETVNCMGACSLSPAIAINEKIYGNLGKSEIEKLLADLK